MSQNVTNNRKIVVEWRKPLGVPEAPYAYRWRLDFYYFSFRVHKWICSDDDRAYHSHPVNMLILVLRGWYIDVQPHEERRTKSRLYSAGEMRVIKRDTKHFVTIPKGVICWTLLFTWGVPKRWAFWDKLTGKKMNRDRWFIEKGHHICK